MSAKSDAQQKAVGAAVCVKATSDSVAASTELDPQTLAPLGSSRYSGLADGS